MSRLIGVEHWMCDVCLKTGPEIDRDETIPLRWLSMAVVVGVPQTAGERSVARRVHLCDACAESFLYNMLSAHTRTLIVERLRALFRRDWTPQTEPAARVPTDGDAT